MTVPFTCVAIAFVFLYVSKFPVGLAMARMPKGYDNRHPRDQQAQLTGWGKRALAAHQNGFESFPAFASAVLVSHVGGGDVYRRCASAALDDLGGRDAVDAGAVPAAWVSLGRRPRAGLGTTSGEPTDAGSLRTPSVLATS